MTNPLMKSFVNLIMCHIFYRVEYTNKEEIENLKRCVICPNHTSTKDPFFIYPKTNNLYVMAKVELFKNKLLAKLFKRYNVFPVDRTKIDVKSTLTATNIFKDNSGDVQFMIFPEGKVIKPNEKIGNVRNGAVFVAATAGVPILPVYISQNVKIFRKIKVTFGKPITIEKDVLESKEKIKSSSKEVLSQIYKLGGINIKDEGEQNERENI